MEVVRQRNDWLDLSMKGLSGCRWEREKWMLQEGQRAIQLPRQGHWRRDRIQSKGQASFGTRKERNRWGGVKICDFSSSGTEGSARLLGETTALEKMNQSPVT